MAMKDRKMQHTNNYVPVKSTDRTDIAFYLKDKRTVAECNLNNQNSFNDKLIKNNKVYPIKGLPC